MEYFSETLSSTVPLDGRDEISGKKHSFQILSQHFLFNSVDDPLNRRAVSALRSLRSRNLLDLVIRK